MHNCVIPVEIEDERTGCPSRAPHSKEEEEKEEEEEEERMKMKKSFIRYHIIRVLQNVDT